MLTTIIIGLSCELQFKNEEEVAYIMDEMKTQTKTSETNPPWHKSEMGKKKEKRIGLPDHMLLSRKNSEYAVLSKNV
jgi:hypothetical protein